VSLKKRPSSLTMKLDPWTYELLGIGAEIRPQGLGEELSPQIVETFFATTRQDVKTVELLMRIG